MVEGRHMLGCGVAYSTTDPDHLLNTRVHNMSGFADRPHHFLDWLRGRP
ncbi:FAD/NAD(P)-binding protein, partial [Escherichia coli]